MIDPAAGDSRPAIIGDRVVVPVDGGTDVGARVAEIGAFTGSESLSLGDQRLHLRRAFGRNPAGAVLIEQHGPRDAVAEPLQQCVPVLAWSLPASLSRFARTIDHGVPDCRRRAGHAKSSRGATSPPRDRRTKRD